MELSIVKSALKRIINRDRKNYLDQGSRIERNQVNLQWWNMPGEENNVGDFLSPAIVEYMKQKNGIHTNRSKRSLVHLFAIGSIIDQSYANGVVWGSGLMYGDRKLWWRNLRKLDIRAVRGPDTRRTLLANGYKCPEVYGDPAILLPLFYRPESTQKESDYKVIQHHSFAQEKTNALSPVTTNWMHFVDEIVKTRLVISSSLHGIILAEAYGIPAIMLKSGLDTFKFNDYYHSTDRYDFPVAGSVEEALRMEPAPLPDLEPLRENLLRTFPVDLWAE